MDSITPLQFWSGILLVSIPSILKLVSDWRAARATEMAAREAAEATLQTSVPQVQTENWERLVQNYQKQIEAMQKLQEENVELRKLPLKLVIMEQQTQQCAEDKEDWKRYATKLSEQVKELGQMPLPFRRTPQDTQDKIKAVTQEQIDLVKAQEEAREQKETPQ